MGILTVAGQHLHGRLLLCCPYFLQDDAERCAVGIFAPCFLQDSNRTAVFQSPTVARQHLYAMLWVPPTHLAMGTPSPYSLLWVPLPHTPCYRYPPYTACYEYPPYTACYGYPPYAMLWVPPIHLAMGTPSYAMLWVPLLHTPCCGYSPHTPCYGYSPHTPCYGYPSFIRHAMGTPSYAMLWVPHSYAMLWVPPHPTYAMLWVPPLLHDAMGTPHLFVAGEHSHLTL